MAKKRWKGGAAAVAQIDTLTVGGTAAAGQTYTVTIGYRSLSYLSLVTDTNATIAAALQAILAASNYGEFLEISWTVNGSVLTATANTAGVPFIITTSASGTGTLTTAATTANAGPNDVSVGVNWDAGTVPVAGDDVFVDYSAIDLLWNLQAFNGIAFNSLTISSTFQEGTGGSGTAGLPELNANGSNPYLEYRQQYLQCSPLTCTIGNGNGNGSGRIKLDFGTGQANLIVHGTGSPLDDNLEALLVKGTNVNNVASVNSGSVGLAVFAEESLTLAALNIGSGVNGAPDVTAGTGCVITTLNMEDGTVLLETAPTTINKTGGSLTVLEGSITTWNERGGSSAYLGTGTIGTLVCDDPIDFSQDPRARVVTNATFNPGGGFSDPLRTVTWTNPFTIAGPLSSVSLDWGQNVKVGLTYL